MKTKVDRDILERELLDLGYNKKFVEYLLKNTPDESLTNPEALEKVINEYCWDRVLKGGEDILKGYEIEEYTGAVLEAVGEGYVGVSEATSYALYLLAKRDLDIDPYSLAEDIEVSLEGE